MGRNLVLISLNVQIFELQIRLAVCSPNHSQYSTLDFHVEGNFTHGFEMFLLKPFSYLRFRAQNIKINFSSSV